MTVSGFTVLAEALTDFRRRWLLLIAADCIARILALSILSLFGGLLLRAFLATTATGVVADTALAEFLVHPIGLAALLICGTFWLAILFAEASQIMIIGFGCRDGGRVSIISSLRCVGRRGPALVKLARLTVVRLLILVAPFVAAIAAVGWFFLRQFDISYYLAEKPPELWRAVAVAAGLAAVMAILVARQVAGWVTALPRVLFEGMDGREALRVSAQAAAPHRRKLILWLLLWAATPLLLAALLHVAAGALIDAWVPRDGIITSARVAILGLILLLNALLSLVLSAVATIAFPLFLVRLYCATGGRGSLDVETGRPEPDVDGIAGRAFGWKPFLASIGVLIVAGVGAFSFLRALDRQLPVEIIAHRGGAAVAPENTLAAFERGIADGADWLELDVQETADGVVVVVHDRDFMRVGRSEREVFAATRAELDGLDVGSFFAPRFADQRVPTLRDVLEHARGRSRLVIELKYYGKDRALESKVVELVESAGMSSDVVVMSLHYDGVLKTARIRPDWTYGYVSAVALGDLTGLPVRFLAVSARTATRRAIRQAHERGKRIYAWTINDPVQMWVMMSRGVDAIITDRVALARQVREMRANMTPLGRFVIWMAGEAGLLRGREEQSPADDA